MKKMGFLVTFLVAMAAHAGVSSNVSHLLDTYLVAKADNHQAPFTDEQVKNTPFTIQVASYINEKDAVSHVEELKLQEKDVVYFPAFVRGQVWFKVCVGRFDKKEDAENYRRQFTKRMDEPFAIVISLLDHPTPDSPLKEAPTKNVAKAEKPVRDPASEHPVKKVEEHVAEKAHDEEGDSVDHMQVKYLPKEGATAKAAVTAVVHAVTPDVHAATPVHHEKAEHKEVAEHHVEEHHMADGHSVVTKNDDHFYSVQVGAFQTEDVAKQNMAQLPTSGHDAYYKMAVVNGKTWYRLLVGHFSTRHEAEDFQKSFAEKVRGAESFIRRITASE